MLKQCGWSLFHKGTFPLLRPHLTHPDGDVCPAAVPPAMVCGSLEVLKGSFTVPE